MYLGIKGKQVLGVSLIVAAVVLIQTLLQLVTLTRVGLEESQARAELVANSISESALAVSAEGADPYKALRENVGLRTILESALFSKDVTFAAIADVNNVAVAHADRSLEGQPMPPAADLNALRAQRALWQLFAVYRGFGTTLELTKPLFQGGREFGSIHVGISTLLIRNKFDEWMWDALPSALLAFVFAVVGATLLAQRLLRPIHVIRSGLTRLGRGEFGVRLDLNQRDEFGELGTFFNAVSAQLSADRSQMAGHVASLESAVEHLEDAVAMVSARGELLFANPAMHALLPSASTGVTLTDLGGAGHPLRQLVEQTLMTRQSKGPVSAAFGEKSSESGGERLIATHAITDAKGELVGVMAIARNLEYLGHVQSTLRYSRKLAALGRLSAGVAHEVKNPLNAMMIHLELLRQQVQTVAARRRVASNELAEAVQTSGSTTVEARKLDRRGGVAVVREAAELDPTAALQHVEVIDHEIRRLDEVVQGFLKFTRPEDLKLQPVNLRSLFGEVLPIVQPEATRAGVTVNITCDGVPDVNGDPAMLRQAFLNLALNACQAMPNGGTLQIRCARAPLPSRVSIAFTDSGVGIQPQHLQRIFDLYFTTKPKGSGIGLSMVYRTVQMHDGEIEVQSVLGQGTTFRILLPQA